MAASLSHAQLEALWTANGGPAASSDVAAAVAQAESGGDPSKINNTAYATRPGYHAPSAGAQPEYSVGLWQINLVAHPGYTEAAMLTPAGNAAAAVAISASGTSFAAWTTYVDGAYIPFLTTAAPSPPAGPTGPTPAQGGASMQAVRAWGGVSDAVARTLPRDIAAAARTTQGALRKLGKLSKVS